MSDPTTRFAPPPDENPEFDRLWITTREAIENAGGYHAETMGVIQEEADRFGLTLDQMARHRLFHILTQPGSVKDWAANDEPYER